MELRFIEALLNALEIRMVDVSAWRKVIECSKYEKNGCTNIPLTLYVDVMNFVNMKLLEINKQYEGLRGISGKLRT